jgi:hypothetical protein
MDFAFFMYTKALQTQLRTRSDDGRGAHTAHLSAIALHPVGSNFFPSQLP